MKLTPRAWVFGAVLMLLVAVGGLAVLLAGDVRPRIKTSAVCFRLQEVVYGNQPPIVYGASGGLRNFRDLFRFAPPPLKRWPQPPRYLLTPLRFYLETEWKPLSEGLSEHYEIELANENGDRVRAAPYARFDSASRTRYTHDRQAGIQWEVVSALVFPRRGSRVRLRLLHPTTGVRVGEFDVPNPVARPSWPEWRPVPLPARAGNTELALELRDLKVDLDAPLARKYPADPLSDWARAHLVVWDRGRRSVGWEANSVYLLDATGNAYGHPFLREEQEGNDRVYYFPQILSSREPAWKLRFRLWRRNAPRLRSVLRDNRPRWILPPLVLPPGAAPWSTTRTTSLGEIRLSFAAQREVSPEDGTPSLRITLTASPSPWMPELHIRDGIANGPVFRDKLSVAPGRGTWRVPIAPEGETLHFQVVASEEPEFEFLMRPHSAAPGAIPAAPGTPASSRQ